MDNIYTTIYLILLLVAMVALFTAIYHVTQMWSDMTVKARKQANWLPWIIPFMASSYTEPGRVHLSRFYKSFFITLICLLAITVLQNIYGKPYEKRESTDIKQSNKSLVRDSQQKMPLTSTTTSQYEFRTFNF